MKQSKIVVTGATSMLGIALMEAALKAGVDRIYAVIRPNSSNSYRLPKSEKIQVVEAEMDDYASLSEYINDKCDVLYHFAWKGTGHHRNDSVFGQCDNISITIHALHAAVALGCMKFIGAGSQAEYGVLDIDKIGPDSPVNPVQNYGITKYAAGKLAMNEAKKTGICCIWVRVFSVYGKYDKPTTMISSSIRKMLNGEQTEFTEGIQLWDYLYSEDAGEAFYQIGEKARESKVYCLGSGKARRLKEYILIMRDAINQDIDPGIGQVPYGNEAVMNLCADITALAEDTGWMPTIEFEYGIKMTIEFTKTQTIDCQANVRKGKQKLDYGKAEAN